MNITNYLIIENNVVTNIVLWDGGNEWTPPEGSIQLIADQTPALIWQENGLIPPSYELVEVMGAGAIGFTWNGTVLTTNQPKPATQGTQTL